MNRLLLCQICRFIWFDSRPRHLNFQRLVISCFQVEIWLKDRLIDVNPQNNQPTNIYICSYTGSLLCIYCNITVLKGLFLVLKLPCECHVGWPESPKGTCSQVLRLTTVDSLRFGASTFFVFRLDWKSNFWVYHNFLFSFTLFSHFRGTNFQLFEPHCLTKDHWRGSVPRMRIKSILSINSY